jgi:hypothetical protein
MAINTPDIGAKIQASIEAGCNVELMPTIPDGDNTNHNRISSEKALRHLSYLERPGYLTWAVGGVKMMRPEGFVEQGR